MRESEAVVPLANSTVYPGGETGQNTSFHRGTNGLIAQLAQLVGRDALGQPEPIDSVGGGLVTTPGLYGQMGTSFIYYVRGTDTGSPEFITDSQGKIKKIVTFPTNVTPTSIIRVTVFYYQNPTFPTKVTTIQDYEELASYYMNSGVLTYDVNSASQNNVHPNP